MLGSVHEPDLTVRVLVVVPVVVGAPKAAFSQKPKASASSGTVMSPSTVTASLIGANGSRPQPRSSEARSGCSTPGEALAKGICMRPEAGATPQVVSNAAARCDRAPWARARMFRALLYRTDVD